MSKTALVTGASAGIGKATVRTLLADGYTVYAAARRVERMQDLADEGARLVRMDITVDEDVQAAVRRIDDEAGGVDVLVNNAGFGLYGSVEDTSLDDARYQFEVNVFGLARLTQLVIPSMRKKGSGTIVNVTSMGGKVYTPMGAWYHATKHALEGWSDCLRVELQPFGIDVVVVEPGAIDTEWGGIMRENLLERSGAGAYAPMARRMAKRSEEFDGRGSPPEVVADVIGDAVRARRPRTRYPVGKLARPLLLARTWLPDRVFDKLITSA